MRRKDNFPDKTRLNYLLSRLLFCIPTNAPLVHSATSYCPTTALPHGKLSTPTLHPPSLLARTPVSSTPLSCRIPPHSPAVISWHLLYRHSAMN